LISSGLIPPNLVNRRALTEQRWELLGEFLQLLAIRLLLWSLLIIVAGVVLLILKPAFARGFGWGLLPLGLLELGLTAWTSFLVKRPPTGSQPSAMDIRMRKLRRLLWLCFFLDLLLLGGSLALALLQPDPLWQGLGWGLSIQAIFLLYFTWFHARKTPKPG
jgi:hypothetical protein